MTARRLLPGGLLLVVLLAGGLAWWSSHRERPLSPGAAARANGEEIRAAEVETLLQAWVRSGKVSQRLGDLQACQRSAECRRELALARSQATDQLIRNHWILDEMRRRGLRFTPKALRMVPRRPDGKPSLEPESSPRLLAMMRLIDQDIRRRSRPRPTDADLRRFWQSRRQRYDHPLSVDGWLLPAQRQSQAATALEVLRRRGPGAMAGQQARYNRRYLSLLGTGGWLVSFVPTGRELGDPLMRALRDAPLDRWQGPLRSRGSWWVFRLSRRIPARHDSWQQVRRELLREYGAFRWPSQYLEGRRRMQRRWRRETPCAPPYLGILCRNGPPLPENPMS